MIAAALLHPDVPTKVVDRFKSTDIDITIQDNLKDAANFPAALIFGGDGTVHRQLPQLHQKKIPMLVVPTGSRPRRCGSQLLRAGVRTTCSARLKDPGRPGGQRSAGWKLGTS